MTTPDDSAAGGTTPSTDPETGGAGGPESQPDYKALYEGSLARIKELEETDWFKRFTGLQGAYQREQERWKKDQDLLSATKAENETLRTAAAEFETKHKTTAEEADTLRTELELSKTSLDRLKIITTEFPHLLSFMAAGEDEEKEDLLPEGTGDELRKKLKAFDAQVRSLGGPPETQKRSTEGASPKPPAPETQNAQTIWAQALDALSKGDMATYETLYTKHLQEMQK